MIKISIVNVSTSEEIASGLYGHSFIIPRIGEVIHYKSCEYELVDVEHEFIGVGSILQSSKIILKVLKRS